MGITYEPAGPTIEAVAAEFIKAVHTTLERVGVEIYWRMAHAPVSDVTGLPKGPAVKVHGRARAWKVKVNSLDLREQGLRDATVTLDGDTWQERPTEEQRSIIDAALESIVVVTDKETGDFLTDDLGRPRLRIKEPELYAEGYEAVLKRHKERSLEAKQLQALWERPVVQGLLNWG